MKKLKLNQLKVKSFATNLDKKAARTVKGGVDILSINVECPIGLPDDTLDYDCLTVLDCHDSD